MAEIIARVSHNSTIELTSDGRNKIEATGELTPYDAIYLARGLLATAVALLGPNPPEAGSMIGDVHFPVRSWIVGVSRLSGDIALVLALPSGVELTFLLPDKGVKELGAALVAQAQGTAPPDGQRGTVH